MQLLSSMNWLKDRGLTLVLLALFAVFTAGLLVTGWAENNDDRARHGEAPLGAFAYLSTGHPWEALFENWESEFLEMMAFVMLTTLLIQKGSPESRRPGVIEAVDADPRRFADDPDAPWPVRQGGWILWIYERSLGLAFALLFLLSWTGHALSGWRVMREEALTHGLPPEPFSAFLRSAAFWFQSFQNWQSEFLGIAAMVWLSVYLRQRGSPESKPVHAPHSQND
jgi:hypothetical protein